MLPRTQKVESNLCILVPKMPRCCSLFFLVCSFFIQNSIQSPIVHKITLPVAFKYPNVHTLWDYPICKGDSIRIRFTFPNISIDANEWDSETVFEKVARYGYEIVARDPPGHNRAGLERKFGRQWESESSIGRQVDKISIGYGHDSAQLELGDGFDYPGDGSSFFCRTSTSHDDGPLGVYRSRTIRPIVYDCSTRDPIVRRFTKVRGQDLSLPCLGARDEEDEEIRWTLDGHPLEGRMNFELDLKNISELDAGIYRCMATWKNRTILDEHFHRLRKASGPDGDDQLPKSPLKAFVTTFDVSIIAKHQVFNFRAINVTSTSTVLTWDPTMMARNRFGAEHEVQGSRFGAIHQVRFTNYDLREVRAIWPSELRNDSYYVTGLTPNSFYGFRPLGLSRPHVISLEDSGHIVMVRALPQDEEESRTTTNIEVIKTDIGQTVDLSCGPGIEPWFPGRVEWTRKPKWINPDEHKRRPNETKFRIESINASDFGIYTCSIHFPEETPNQPILWAIAYQRQIAVSSDGRIPDVAPLGPLIRDLACSALNETSLRLHWTEGNSTASQLRIRYWLRRTGSAATGNEKMVADGQEEAIFDGLEPEKVYTIIAAWTNDYNGQSESMKVNCFTKVDE